MEKDKHTVRKEMRWKKQDYSDLGEYAITICVKDNKQILSRVVIDENKKRAIRESPLRVSNNQNVSNSREEYTENYVMSDGGKQNNNYYKTKSSTVGAIHESPANAKIKLTPIGQIVDDVINNLPDHLGVKILKYVIMPNHIHLLISIPETKNYDRIPARSTISKTIGYIKMNSSKKIREKFNYTNIWQRSFYDHVIRDDNDLTGAKTYIDENPAKWLAREEI